MNRRHLDQAADQVRMHLSVQQTPRRRCDVLHAMLKDRELYRQLSRAAA